MSKPSTPEEFPSAFNGGEEQDQEKRIGEGRPNSPDLTDIDPAHTEHGLDGAKPIPKRPAD